MPDVILKDEFGISQPYEDINAVLLDTEGGGTATFISPDIIPAQVQADWEQTDETAVDFIKNKPTSFGGDYTHPETHPASMISGLVVKDLPSLNLDTYKFTLDDFGSYYYTLPGAWDGLEGITYKIMWDSTEYTCTCHHVSKIKPEFTDAYYMGNGTKLFHLGHGEDTGEPFIMLLLPDRSSISTDDTEHEYHTISITPIDEVKKLDSKYLPDGLATQEWVNNEISKIDINNGGSSGAIETEIFPETKLEGFQLSGNSYSIGFPATFELIVGEEYKVYWDGEYYTCTAFESVQGSYNLIMLGNCEAVTQGSTVITEPFVITYVPDNNYINVASADGSTATSHTVCIYRKIDAPTIPEFTTEDEGKVLGIKDGVVDWVSIESSVAVKEKDILPEQEFTFTSVEDNEGCFQFMTDTKDSELLQILSVLMPGETYYIAIDGVEYECTAQSCFEIGAPRPADSEIYADAALGNIGIANPEFTDTGEPFVVMVLSYAQFSDDGSISNENHNAAIVLTGEASAESETRSIRIYKKVEESNNYIKWDELCREDNVTTETDLFKKQRIDGFYQDEDFYGLYCKGFTFLPGYSDSIDSFEFIAGESYIVEWDGVTYEVVGQDVSLMMPNSVAVGNGTEFGYIGNNEPFIIGVQKGAGVTFMSLLDREPTPHTIRIYTSASSIETNIKSEFLPKHLQFGEVNGTIALIDGTYKATYYANNSQWEYEPVPIISDVHLELDKTYTIKLNDVEYTCKGKMIEAYSIIAVGNLAIVGMGEDTGEPFAIAEDTQGLSFGEPAFVVITTDVNNVDTTVTTEITSDIKLTCIGVVVKKINSKYLYQPDWNETDSSKYEYILNKPFGDMKAGTVISKGTVNCLIELRGQYAAPLLTISFIDGVSYSVTFDNVNYTIKAISNGSSTSLEIPEGSGDIYFKFIDNYFGMSILSSTQGEHTYTITYAEDTVKKIDSKYLPDDIGGSSLPEVTTLNNGQVMTVINGEWTAQTPASGLPTVTSSDAGKFLRVDSSGNWVAETIPNAEGVSF